MVKTKRGYGGNREGGGGTGGCGGRGGADGMRGIFSALGVHGDITAVVVGEGGGGIGGVYEGVAGYDDGEDGK